MDAYWKAFSWQKKSETKNCMCVYIYIYIYEVLKEAQLMCSNRKQQSGCLASGGSGDWLKKSMRTFWDYGNSLYPEWEIEA